MRVVYENIFDLEGTTSETAEPFAVDPRAAVLTVQLRRTAGTGVVDVLVEGGWSRDDVDADSWATVLSTTGFDSDVLTEITENPHETNSFAFYRTTVSTDDDVTLSVRVVGI